MIRLVSNSLLEDRLSTLSHQLSTQFVIELALLLTGEPHFEPFGRIW